MRGLAPLEANIREYNRSAHAYEAHHPSIFNQHEQARLAALLGRAKSAIESDGARALDYGCGSGNLTRHLLGLGFEVTAADVTPAFLNLVEERYSVATVELVGGTARAVPDRSFDLIGAYAVLHHIPDYAATVQDLIGKLKPGGVLVIDHEFHANEYFPPPELLAFRAEINAAKPNRWWDPDRHRWQHLLRAAVTPSRHAARYRRLTGRTGDIDLHVHLDDHIDWDRVIAAINQADGEVVERFDHLLFVDGYPEEIWERWRSRTCNQTSLIARRLHG